MSRKPWADRRLLLGSGMKGALFIGGRGLTIIHNLNKTWFIGRGKAHVGSKVGGSHVS